MGGQNSVTTTNDNEQQQRTTNTTDDHNSPPGFFQNPWANTCKITLPELLFYSIALIDLFPKFQISNIYVVPN